MLLIQRSLPPPNLAQLSPIYAQFHCPMYFIFFIPPTTTWNYRYCLFIFHLWLLLLLILLLSPPVNQYGVVSIYLQNRKVFFSCWWIMSSWPKVAAIFFPTEHRICALFKSINFPSRSVDLSWPSVTMLVLTEGELLITDTLMGEWHSWTFGRTTVYFILLMMDTILKLIFWSSRDQ